MRQNTYWIYFIAYDGTVHEQRVSASSLLKALIKASARQIEAGRDCLFYKAKKQDSKDRFADLICFDYGKDNPSSLTY